MIRTAVIALGIGGFGLGGLAMSTAAPASAQPEVTYACSPCVPIVSVTKEILLVPVTTAQNIAALPGQAVGNITSLPGHAFDNIADLVGIRDGKLDTAENDPDGFQPNPDPAA